MSSSPILSVIGAAFASLIVILSRTKAEPDTQRRMPAMVVLAVLAILMLARVFLPQASCITEDYPRLAVAAR